MKKNGLPIIIKLSLDRGEEEEIIEGVGLIQEDMASFQQVILAAQINFKILQDHMETTILIKMEMATDNIIKNKTQVKSIVKFVIGLITASKVLLHVRLRL